MQLNTNDDLLPLSGIQHFAFCERQWALIHIEQAWQENVLTVEGRHIHERVDDPFKNETRGDLRIVRSVPILSLSLGLQGVADLIEFQKVENCSQSTVVIPDESGFWLPRPVEFKRGKPKPDDRDAVQLCAQAICIEEMMGVSINKGYIYYWEVRRRQTVEINEVLRTRTRELASRMHEYYRNGVTPTNTQGKSCRSCSLIEICQPKLIKKRQSVSEYIYSFLRADEEVGKQ